ncbi:DNA primase [Leptobacterium sp. I13]|uniref:DNA primase n=1 Tax=Leptobacterium meishanense TaxID=3128904 RepID=UPI0030EBFCC0
MYTQNSIDKVREADIVQVVGHFITLKKEGANYKAKSPFVDEKTPSFVVSPVKQIFKCFSTGQGGDAIKFVKLYKNLSFIEAVKAIAGICNILLEEEELSEERKSQIKTAQSLKALNDNVAKAYAKQLQHLPHTHWAKKLLQDRGYDNDAIIEFQLGYAPGNLVSKAVVKNGTLELAKETGLVKTSAGTSYDFFKERIIFPIHNKHGQVIAFGGRRSDEEDVAQYAKYLNTSESVIYNKSKTLYGLYQAQRSIAKSNYAVLVEGYTDVITLHQHNCTTAVATCGTALTFSHAKQLAHLCEHIIILRDGDKAGMNAILKENGDIDTLLSVGLKVSVCVAMDDEDPDSMCRLPEMDIVAYINENHEDALLWKAALLLDVANDDPTDKAKSLDKLIASLTVIKSEVVRKEYVKRIGSLYKQSPRTIEKSVKTLIAEQEAAALKKAERNGELDFEQHLGLPKGADKDQFVKDRFAVCGNTYFFQGNNGFFKGTNFKITPLFHIYGRADNKRLCEVVNELGHKRLVDFESKDFINFTKIQEKLIEEGYFVWLPNTQNIHFKLVAQKILNDFIMAYELKTLGWQKERFFAFADGVFHSGHFQEVNKYGIIQVETSENVASEYTEEVKHFYSPAFSEIYKASREDDDPYENDRSFVYKQAPVSFSTWMKQMCLVYKDKGNIAIAFAIASVFRDYIISRHSFFPHLFLSGEKGSGKSKFGDSIANVFTYKLAPFDLNSGTLVGFYRRLARIKNIPVFFEEFHDKIDDRMFQSLKAAYDGRGREKGNITSDNRTTISKINSSCIIAGQYLSSRDDNSLTSRSIINHFIKPSENFTNEEVGNYDLLKSWEEQGLSSFVLDILKHRNLIEQNFHKAFSSNMQRFKNDLLEFEYQERMLMNYNAIYTPVSILQSYFDFPFTIEEFYKQCLNGIIDNSELIIESEGIAEFWKVLEHLFKHNIIREGFDFVIDKPIDVTVNPKKETKETYKNAERHPILFLRLNSVHQEYHKEVSKRDGVDVIGESTIRNYFKSKKYFIGPKSGHRFNDGVKSCYLFNYDMMKKQGILNLDKENVPMPGNSNESKDKLPY